MNRKIVALPNIVLIVSLTGCGTSSGDRGTEAEDLSNEADRTPVEYTSFQDGFLAYEIPADWELDTDLPSDWIRLLGSHPDYPYVAAAELAVYVDFPEVLDVEDATDFIIDEFPLDDEFELVDAQMSDIPGAEESYRVDYEQRFTRPEFDVLHIADFGIRAESGELMAVRVSAVTDLVEDGTFDAIVDSFHVLS